MGWISKYWQRFIEKRCSKSSDLKSGGQTLEYPRELYRCKMVWFLGLLDVFRCVYVQCMPFCSNLQYLLSPRQESVSVQDLQTGNVLVKVLVAVKWVLGIRHVLSKLQSLSFYCVWQVKQPPRGVSCKNSSRSDLVAIFLLFSVKTVVLSGFCGQRDAANHSLYLLSVLLTAPSMIRTMNHLKVQMQMREGGQPRGTWDRVHNGHRKMARNPVSNSWLSQPGQIIRLAFVKRVHVN